MSVNNSAEADQAKQNKFTSGPVAAEELEKINQMIRLAAELLPTQGPITAFVFLNTLQALEDLPFDEGLKKGARLFGNQPYLVKDRYREHLASGRISIADLQQVLHEDLGERDDEHLGSLGTRFELRLAMLEHPLRIGSPEELRWFVAETDALTRMRADASPLMRDHLLKETRHWIMRDVCGSRANHASAHEMLADILRHHGEEHIEQWNDATWETVALQSLWRICRTGVQATRVPPAEEPIQPIRNRDLLLQACGEDSDAFVHELLIRFSASYADQGFADWSLPNREAGYFQSFLALYGEAGGPPDHWLHDLSRELSRLADTKTSPLESIHESLQLLGVEREEWDDYLTASLLALRGWAGLIWQMEVRADRVALPAAPGTLVEFMAVRLVLERCALKYVVREQMGWSGELRDLRAMLMAKVKPAPSSNFEQRALIIFQLAQVLGWSPATLFALSPADWARLIEETEAFSLYERRRVFHLAFERNFRTRALDTLAAFTHRPAKRVENPRFQASFCIDTREDSFRRHLEEVAPDTETFAVAGFYGVAMYFRGVADAHFAALCPIVVFPKHWVVEEVVYSLEEAHKRRAKTRQAFGNASHQVHRRSRSIAGGAFLTASFGVLASIPLLARVLFPRFTSRISRTAGRLLEPPQVTRLRLERTAATPGPEDDQIGFSLEEMTNTGERMLRDMGLTSSFARLVFFFGHGSFCLNNPHKSAYDCGACSGGAGGPNARALAVMLNDPRVRQKLAERGLTIPKDTYFIGGLHNTCEDSLTFYDLDLLPKSHLHDFEEARKTFDEVCQRNAHERCRRFYSAPLNITVPAAKVHVEGRAQDLAQTRPEFGNASNAMCFVGRRSRLRGLYLDRRCFMHSYDPTQDDAETTILARILAPVVPVCQGINLQYFFSSVDSPGWGCGTKLPHNVTSLLGVMDGYASDLRSGLPQQGVEIHEPVRLLFVIETTPAAMLSIMERNNIVGRILKNGWGQLAVLDPNSAQLHIYREGKFLSYEPHSNQLPQAATSIDWYRGWRDHLGFAIIGSA